MTKEQAMELNTLVDKIISARHNETHIAGVRDLQREFQEKLVACVDDSSIPIGPGPSKYPHSTQRIIPVRGERGRQV